MKKLLALVLAMVMVLSLCVTSNAAFDDAADVDYKEAVDVLSAVGVFVGDGSGNFYPDQNLTRAQATKIIAYLDLGESVAEALPAVQLFSDVPATHWAAKYVAYCADAEIVAGVGNGQFAPDAQVTGYQFAKMLLVVLGYDVEFEKLVGTNWSISTAKLVKENKLSKGFSGSFNDGLTREGAAQIAFNALKAQPVYTYTGYGLTVNSDNMIVTNANGKAVKNPATGFVQNDHSLYADLYDGKLSSDPANDKLANPAHKWVYKNAKVGTYTDTPVLTYTTSWTWAQAKEDLAAAGVEIDTVENNLEKFVTIYTNGYACASDTKDYNAMKRLIKDNTKLGGNGIVTNFYADSDDFLNRVTVAEYQLAKVTAVTKDKASTKLVNEAALTLEATKGTGTYTANEDTIGFGAVYADAEVGDYFLVTANNVGFDYATSIKAPVTAEGLMTFAGTTSCKFDGTTYSAGKMNESCLGSVSDKTQTLYLDEYGYAYGTGSTLTDHDYCVVLKNYLGLDNGELVTMLKVVYADGTVGTIDPKDADNNASVNTVYAYAADSSEYDLTYKTAYKLTEDVAAGALKFNANGTPYFFADDVTVTYVYNNNGTYKTSTENAVKKIVANTDIFWMTDSDGLVDAMFVLEKPNNTLSSTNGLILLTKEVFTNGTAKDVDGKTVNNMKGYDAYVDGEPLGDFITKDAGTVGAFYLIEKDTQIEGAYILAGNHYVDTNEDVQSAENVYIDADDTAAKSNVIVLANTGAAVRTTGETVFVVTDSTINTEIANFTDLDNYMDDCGHGVTISVLYDDDTNNALYVYIVKDGQ